MTRVGLAYDLRDDYRAMGFSEEAIAEFDSPETIEAIEGALQRLGFETDRIGHVRRLTDRLSAGDRWDIVFNIAEGVKGRCREAQVPALLEAFDLPYVFSDPLVMAVTLDKAVAKQLVQAAGVPTARFQVMESPEDAKDCTLDFPVFAKPLAEGTGKGCEPRSKVENTHELAQAVEDLAERFRQPVLVEHFLPGREFTVGIVGNGKAAQVVAVLEVKILGSASRDAVYSHDAKEFCESQVEYVLAHDSEAALAADHARAAYRALQCRDAGRVDMRSDAHGVPHFLEVNPIAGLHPSHSDLPILSSQAGWSYDRLIGTIMAAALERYGMAMPGTRRRVA